MLLPATSRPPKEFCTSWTGPSSSKMRHYSTSLAQIVFCFLTVNVFFWFGVTRHAISAHLSIYLLNIGYFSKTTTISFIFSRKRHDDAPEVEFKRGKGVQYKAGDYKYWPHKSSLEIEVEPRVETRRLFRP
jgi:hypothetical protein